MEQNFDPQDQTSDATPPKPLYTTKTILPTKWQYVVETEDHIDYEVTICRDGFSSNTFSWFIYDSKGVGRAEGRRDPFKEAVECSEKALRYAIADDKKV